MCVRAMKKDYLQPMTRVKDLCFETSFLQTGVSGTIDPGYEDDWGNL